MTALKLFLLQPKRGLKESDNAWDYFDTVTQFIVRAENEKEARLIAHNNAGAENFHGITAYCDVAEQPWLDTKYSTCIELTTEGSQEVVLRVLL